MEYRSSYTRGELSVGLKRKNRQKRQKKQKRAKTPNKNSKNDSDLAKTALATSRLALATSGLALATSGLALANPGPALATSGPVTDILIANTLYMPNISLLVPPHGQGDGPVVVQPGPDCPRAGPDHFQPGPEHLWPIHDHHQHFQGQQPQLSAIRGGSECPDCSFRITHLGKHHDP